ncbi:MAG: hypothetical protein NUV85_03975 [Candidatus Berkelbacteria bacterium]|nr:hypothetical protein [Candidatus Berkelbacteria bacterium]
MGVEQGSAFRSPEEAEAAAAFNTEAPRDKEGLKNAIEAGLRISKLNIERSARALMNMEVTDPKWEDWMTLLKEGIEGAENDRRELLELGKN